MVCHNVASPYSFNPSSGKDFWGGKWPKVTEVLKQVEVPEKALGSWENCKVLGGVSLVEYLSFAVGKCALCRTWGVLLLAYQSFSERKRTFCMTWGATPLTHLCFSVGRCGTRGPSHGRNSSSTQSRWLPPDVARCRSDLHPLQENIHPYGLLYGLIGRERKRNSQKEKSEGTENEGQKTSRIQRQREQDNEREREEKDKHTINTNGSYPKKYTTNHSERANLALALKPVGAAPWNWTSC